MSEQMQKTRDYDSFKRMKGNRPISPKHVHNIINSIKNKNMLESNPILVNEGLEIIDGQHRLEAARELRKTIYYNVRKGYSLEEARLTNVVNRPWTISDFLESWIEQGKEDYKFLKNFAVKYELPLSVSMHLLTGQSPRGGGLESNSRALTLFRQGKFSIQNLIQAEYIGKILKEIQPFTEGNIYKQRTFVAALIRLESSIKLENLIEQMKRYPLKLRSRVTVKEYLRDFEDVYNFRKRKNFKTFYNPSELKMVEVN